MQTRGLGLVVCSASAQGRAQWKPIGKRNRFQRSVIGHIATADAPFSEDNGTRIFPREARNE